MSANQNSQDHVGRIASPPHRGLWATLGEGFAQILYPRWCPVCHTLLSPAAPPLCLSCQSLLSDYHEETIHALDRLRGARIAPRRLLAPPICMLARGVCKRLSTILSTMATNP